MKSINLDRDFLYQKYVIENKTIDEISLKLNCYRSTVRRYLKKYGLTKTRHTRFKDLTGKKIGRWTVLKEVDKRNGDICWLCRCDCGKEKVQLSTSLTKNKNSNSCGCLNSDLKYKGYKEISASYWYSITSGAKDRNFEFSISKEYAWDLFLKQDRKCALSGLELKFTKSMSRSYIQTASLDRIDNTKGYIEGNVQWVHRDINQLKHKFSQDKLFCLCKLIYQYNKLENVDFNIQKITQLKYQ